MIKKFKHKCPCWHQKIDISNIENLLQVFPIIEKDIKNGLFYSKHPIKWESSNEDEVEIEMEDLNKRLADAEDERDELKDDKRGLQNEVDELERNLVDEKERVKELETEKIRLELLLANCDE